MHGVASPVYDLGRMHKLKQCEGNVKLLGFNERDCHFGLSPLGEHN